MDEPINVKIDEPITLKNPILSPEMRRFSAAQATASATEAETTLHTAGQRRVNMIWERTQSIIALSVVLTTCGGIIALGSVRFWNINLATDAIPSFPPEWWTIVGLVIGFYFGRTNHARMGDALVK